MYRCDSDGYIELLRITYQYLLCRPTGLHSSVFKIKIQFQFVSSYIENSNMPSEKELVMMSVLKELLELQQKSFKATIEVLVGGLKSELREIGKEQEELIISKVLQWKIWRFKEASWESGHRNNSCLSPNQEHKHRIEWRVWRFRMEERISWKSIKEE